MAIVVAPGGKLTPMMFTALCALAGGPLYLSADGWVSARGERWNSHTIKYLAGCGLCEISGESAEITDRGREVQHAAEVIPF